MWTLWYIRRRWTKETLSSCKHTQTQLSLVCVVKQTMWQTVNTHTRKHSCHWFVLWQKQRDKQSTHKHKQTHLSLVCVVTQTTWQTINTHTHTQLSLVCAVTQTTWQTVNTHTHSCHWFVLWQKQRDKQSTHTHTRASLVHSLCLWPANATWHVRHCAPYASCIAIFIRLNRLSRNTSKHLS